MSFTATEQLKILLKYVFYKKKFRMKRMLWSFVALKIIDGGEYSETRLTYNSFKKSSSMF